MSNASWPMRVGADGSNRIANEIETTGSPRPRGPMVLHDDAMVSLCQKAERLARGKISILLLGETGVGKERVAERIHQASGRASEPFIAVNCAAVNPNLFESELFGHERGAFTGADRAKPGWLELARAGTVFLDEVGELPLDCQAKLLRAIDSATVVPVGGTGARPLRARFVAATNRELSDAVARGTFRSDLYYRLAGATLVVPPLRERPSEILPLARTFAREAEPARTLTKEAEAALLRHSWPGNIRELGNVIERAVLLAEGPAISAADLGLVAEAGITAGRAVASAQEPAVPHAGAVALGGFSQRLPSDPEQLRDRIEAALQATGRNQTNAAALLGISRATLCRHLAKLGLSRPRTPTPVTLDPCELDRVSGGRLDLQLYAAPARERRLYLVS